MLAGRWSGPQQGRAAPVCSIYLAYIKFAVKINFADPICHSQSLLFNVSVCSESRQLTTILSISDTFQEWGTVLREKLTNTGQTCQTVWQNKRTQSNTQSDRTEFFSNTLTRPWFSNRITYHYETCSLPEKKVVSAGTLLNIFKSHMQNPFLKTSEVGILVFFRFSTWKWYSNFDLWRSYGWIFDDWSI